MSPKIVTLLLLSASFALVQAAPRNWKSEDGSYIIPADFLKRDATSITIIRTSDRKEITIPLEKLHPDDRKWVNANESEPTNLNVNDQSLVFDKLSFGQTRAEVLAKLKTSKFVELTVAETFLGRTGLNDVFRTRKKIGGLDASLFFEWTEDGKLKEITLQTRALPSSALKDQLSPCWKEFTGLLTTLYGKPVHATKELRVSTIQEGMLIPTHLWSLENNGSAMLGVSRDGKNYMVVVRFSQKAAQRVALP